MRIFMSSVNFSDEIIVYPILSFDTKIVKILVAQHVSPRTRRITQIADQAQEEGKTLTQKLIDIGLESGVDVTNMSELRAILDQETQCMPCYRLHSHHDAIPTSRCTCECHHNTDKLLIFHGSDERVHVKVITETLLEKAREANRRRGDPEGSPDRNRLYFPLNHCTVFDTVDHVFRTGASLVDSSMCLTPDNKYLYVTGTTKRSVDGEIVFEVKPICLDLDTMVLKNQPDFTNIPWVDCDYEVRVTANNDFVAIFSGHDVAIWSSYHRGHIAAALHFDGPVSCVALHPYQNSMCVTNEKLVHFYHSPVMAQEEE